MVHWLYLARKRDLVKRYIDKNGKARLHGDVKKLNQSAVYPVGFGYAMAPCLVCNYHVVLGWLSSSLP